MDIKRLKKIINENNIQKRITTTINKQNKKMMIITTSSIVLMIIILFFLQNNSPKIEKTDFYAQVQSISELNNNININKPGKIVWAEEIVISAQAMWSIKDIYVKEWDTASPNTKLINIKDDTANYGIMVQRAKNALNSARLQYWQQKTQIEQWIANSQLAIEQSKTALNTAQTLWEENLKSATNNLQNANTQKNALVSQLISEKGKLESLVDDILHQTDTVLWVTTEYKTKNDAYEIYLSAKNTSYKLQWKSQILSLYKQRDILKALNTDTNIPNKELKENVQKMDQIYSDIKNLLNTMENIYIKSVTSTVFPKTKLDWLMSANNMSQTVTQTNFTYFTQFKQSLDSALISNWDDYTIAWNDAANIWYNSTLASTQQQIVGSQIWLQTAQINYDSSVKNKNNILWLASANITSAQLAYQEVLKQFQKLTVVSPITGTIWKILIDKWQDIRVWTPLLTIINNSDPIIEIGITATEYQKINSWSIISILYIWQTLSGEILSISSQADINGMYNMTIKLNKKIENIWDTAQVTISSKTNKTTLPINTVHPLEKNKWYINIINKDNQPDILNITLWKARWDQIEITSEIPKNTKIIINDISNYNPNIHNIVIQ